MIIPGKENLPTRSLCSHNPFSPTKPFRPCSQRCSKDVSAFKAFSFVLSVKEPSLPVEYQILSVLFDWTLYPELQMRTLTLKNFILSELYSNRVMSMLVIHFYKFSWILWTHFHHGNSFVLFSSQDRHCIAALQGFTVPGPEAVMCCTDRLYIL